HCASVEQTIEMALAASWTMVVLASVSGTSSPAPTEAPVTSSTSVSLCSSHMTFTAVMLAAEAERQSLPSSTYDPGSSESGPETAAALSVTGACCWNDRSAMELPDGPVRPLAPVGPGSPP